MSTVFKNQLRIAPELAGDDFIQIVGTVAQEKTHIYVQQGAAHKKFLTVTVHTVEKNHDVHFKFLTNSAEDACIIWTKTHRPFPTCRLSNPASGEMRKPSNFSEFMQFIRLVQRMPDNAYMSQVTEFDDDDESDDDMGRQVAA